MPSTDPHVRNLRNDADHIEREMDGRYAWIAEVLRGAADRIEADALLLESLLYAQDRVAAALTTERDALRAVVEECIAIIDEAERYVSRNAKLTPEERAIRRKLQEATTDEATP